MGCIFIKLECSVNTLTALRVSGEKPVLFRYNRKKLRFEFFNDKLRRENPATEVDYFNVKYFAFGSSLYFQKQRYDEA
jgi:hypothetical protein